MEYEWQKQPLYSRTSRPCFPGNAVNAWLVLSQLDVFLLCFCSSATTRQHSLFAMLSLSSHSPVLLCSYPSAPCWCCPPTTMDKSSTLQYSKTSLQPSHGALTFSIALHCSSVTLLQAVVLMGLEPGTVSALRPLEMGDSESGSALTSRK